MKPKNDGQRIVARSDRNPTSFHDYNLVTPMMDDLELIVASGVERMETGICITAPSRFGKTRALNHVERMVRVQDPSVTIERLICKDRSRESDRTYHRAVLRSVQLDYECINRSDDTLDALVRALLTRCSDKGDPRILFLIDEAQRLTERQYSYLIDLTNELENVGLASTVALMGQTELLGIRDRLYKAKRYDIIGRFFENPLILQGVDNEEALTKIAHQYDDYRACAFPADSQNSITAAYLPHLFKSGFRLEHHVQLLWKSLEAIAGAMQSPPVIGMKGATRVIERALVKLQISQDANAASSKDWWKNTLLETGYVHQLKNMASVTPP